MASREAVANILAGLGEMYRRRVTQLMAQLYHGALADLEDETLVHAASVCARTCKFFPTVAELRDAVGANEHGRVDAEPIIAAIRSLGEYSPTGMRWPPVVTVRRQLGEVVAEVYGRSGASQLFADNETTREIARREFRTTLEKVARERGTPALQLAAVTGTHVLDAGTAGPDQSLGGAAEDAEPPRPTIPTVTNANTRRVASWREVLSDPSYRPSTVDYEERRRCLGNR
jgi:hypothetical protein